MTEYFEVISRDGTARLGEIRIQKKVKTPAIVDNIIEDSGSLWSSNRKEPKGDESKITVLPHRSIPIGTPKEIIEAKQEDPKEVSFPSAVVQSSERAKALGHDMYIITDLRERGREIVKKIIEVRKKLEPDSALMAPSLATPSNIAILSYLGIDCFDSHRAAVKGKEGIYMTPDGGYQITQLNELPCFCNYCTDSDPESISKDKIAKHNILHLKSELSKVRDKIINGKIREYIEAESRHNRWQVEAMRIMDTKEYSEKRAPVARRSRMNANSEESMDRSEVQRFSNRTIDRYTAPRSDTAVLLPCSAKKPYSESQSHKKLQNSIRGKAHEIIITSPIGIVPRELELTYPAGHYDTPVTGRWSEGEKKFVSNLLSNYLKKNSYERVISHVPEEGYKKVVEKAAKKCKTEVECTTSGDPRSKKSLQKLEKALEGNTQASYKIQDKWYIRGISDYQFGESSFDKNLALENVKVEGRFPQLRLLSNSEELLATLTPEYGLLSLTIDGARVFDPPKVTIDEFYPKGSVLAPGIKNADNEIRVGDEVFFEGPRAIGVGRSKMFGEEMIKSNRGIAIDVRHVEEK